MAWNFTSDRPIYLQLIEHIQADVISGKYAPGVRLPSVRELAAEASVNPNTMQRALSELEESGLLISQRTTGRFVTEDYNILEESKLLLARKIAQEFKQKISKLGYSSKDAIELLKNL
ncbi:MAG: GntR family transcriptional regulator [Eubacteriales bacterium]|nr:GntR family transcriptional regulator [Eubacteriales bacterium]MDD4422352.1 GntR family transcriptional regulator [Eubacteriales bacterium]HBR30473.1 GntR family transcriptional regulator [Clostridiales bacterium]